jgi:hypothetical protein
VLGAQLDLFGDRHLRLESARRALAEGRADDAVCELVRLRGCYPDDPAIAVELDLARKLIARLDEIDASAPVDRPRELMALARMPGLTESLRARLLHRAASELWQAAGPCALINGKAASVLLRKAGDLHAAWALAAEAARQSPRARFLAYLADVEHQLGQKTLVRARYREALALDPYDVDWSEIADDDVKVLPELAESELELDDGIAWAAPVGVVLRVLPIGDPPAPLEPAARLSETPGRVHAELSELPQDGRGRVDAGPSELVREARDRVHDELAELRHDELRRPHEFLRALIDASQAQGAAVIDARRRMRTLAPQLLATYLERM